MNFKMKLLVSIWSYILLFGTTSILAQTAGDTSRVESMPYKSPRAAMIRSALLPGLGQWYNGQKFKAVLVFGGELGLMANAIYQNQRVVQSKTEGERAFYLNNRSLSLWWLFGIYLLNILDAYVDAHLMDFDVGPELSFVPSSLASQTIRVSASFPF
jgi:hypothetical protein